MKLDHRNDPANQIDPFNAPDPVMPGGEPDLSPTPSPSADKPPAAKSRRRKTTKRRGYQAPVEHPDAYEAPSTDGTPGTVAAERIEHAARKAKRAAKAAASRNPARQSGGKGCRPGCIALIVCFLLFSGAFGSFVSSCASAIFDDSDSSWESSGISYEVDIHDEDFSDEVDPYDLTDDVERAVSDRVQDDIATIIDEHNDEIVSRLATEFADDVASYCGVSFEATGLDAQAAAQWVVDNTTFTIDDVSSYVDSYDDFTFSTTVYVDSYHPATYNLAYEVSTFMWDRFASNYHTGMTFTASEQQEFADALVRAEEAVLAEGYEYPTSYPTLDYTNSSTPDGLTITTDLDHASVEAFVLEAFGIYE